MELVSILHFQAHCEGVGQGGQIASGPDFTNLPPPPFEKRKTVFSLVVQLAIFFFGSEILINLGGWVPFNYFFIGEESQTFLPRCPIWLSAALGIFFSSNISKCLKNYFWNIRMQSNDLRKIFWNKIYIRFLPINLFLKSLKQSITVLN